MVSGQFCDVVELVSVVESKSTCSDHNTSVLKHFRTRVSLRFSLAVIFLKLISALS